MASGDRGHCAIGVGTGSPLHVVILRPDLDNPPRQHLVYIGVHHDFEELEPLVKRFMVDRCVIDGLPEQHATRKFAAKCRGVAYLHFFNENQRGAPKLDHHTRKVESNRTESLDASRAAIRERRVVLPRREPIVETFARHMAADAKKLEEDAETGAKRYRYIRAGGADHLSLAFTYAWLGSQDYSNSRGILQYYRMRKRQRELAGR